MEYFAGLDISMKETHICVVDRDGCPVTSRCQPQRIDLRASAARRMSQHDIGE
jgi:hypothetical protein